MITVSDVTKGYGGRTLFEGVNVAFSAGQAYGLTGPNGCGKSTMMKILIGAEESDSGHVSRPERTAWLRQDHYAFDEYTVMDTVFQGNQRLWDAMQRKEAIYAKGDDITDEEGELLGELECVVAEEDGYTADADAAILLSGLGIGEELHYAPMSEVQGGMKVRVLLAQSLFGKPDAMLLDEPTNHLDMESIQWLEDFLSRYDGVLVVISHDRRFLNAVCTQIADIDYETIILYPGNYDDMVRQKAQIRGRLDKETAEKHKKIAQLKEFVQRFGAGSRASQVRSRAKQIERLRPDEIKRSNIARPYIRFSAGEQSGRDVLEVRDLSHAYDDHVIFSGLNTMVHRGDKVAILGRNGIGKTTLVRALLDPKNEEDGKVKWGHNTRIGYFGHDHREEITPGMTVFTWLAAQRPDMYEQDVRAVLGRMLFSGEDGQKPTATLSGGEAARLKMCELILNEYNVLLLDEPTDHLDLESISALRDAIEAYEGTVFYVTHDRDLASAANRLFTYPKPGELIDYDGGVDAYLAWYESNYQKAS
ncbi:MAG: ATP-binding cassette domain-containing protein [Deltaproteobacteria bacterium]|nr:MAG: ATP-binding cassette domain-containing protein [Deltaproteobacteria bacterium]